MDPGPWAPITKRRSPVVIAAIGLAIAVPAALALTVDVLGARRRDAAAARGDTTGIDETS